MKVCFPVSEDLGINSVIYGHFNSAPFFLVVDIETQKTQTIFNCDPKEPFAGCNPFMALKSIDINGIIAGCMGDSALQTMNLCGHRVFEAESQILSKIWSCLNKTSFRKQLFKIVPRRGDALMVKIRRKSPEQAVAITTMITSIDS